MDGEPWLLSTPDGIVDLRTGNTVPHDPERYLTKITAVAPGGDCPLWRKFLHEITGGNTELQSFLRTLPATYSPAAFGSTPCSFSTAPAAMAKACS
jgi:phage/plasmid-associated DNA primase